MDYIDRNLDSREVNFLKTMVDILKDIGIDEFNYYKALAISRNTDY